MDQIQRILRGLCELQVLLPVFDNPELMDEPDPLLVLEEQLVLLLPVLEVVAVSVVLQPVAAEVVLLVLELVHVKLVHRRIHKSVLRLQSAFCKMNKLAVPHPRVAEVVVQLMESAEQVLVLELAVVLEQVEVSVVVEVPVSLLPVLLLHLLAAHLD